MLTAPAHSLVSSHPKVPPPAQHRGLTATLAGAGICASFTQTVVIPLQSRLPELLGASRDDTAWVVTATLLSAGLSTIAAGRLGDIYGKRRLILALLGTLAVGSILAAFAPGLPLLIAGRALQGAVAGVIPLGISILRDTLPPERLPTSIALVSATLGAGGAIGLPVSGLVAEFLDWRGLFLGTAILAALAFTMVSIVVPPTTLRAPDTFDLGGAIWLGAGLMGVLLALSRGALWGWTSWLTLSCGLGGIVVLLGWAWYQLRRRSPLVDLRMAARAPVLLTNFASFAMGFSLFTSNVVFPQVLELPVSTGVGLGLDLFSASLMVMPAGLLMMFVAPLAGRLSRSFGSQRLLAVGAVVICGSYAIALVGLTSPWQVFAVSCGIGVGIGLAFAAMPTIVMRAVPNTQTAAANGLNTFMRSLGTTVAAAAVAAILAREVVVVDGLSVPAAASLTWSIGAGACAALLSAIIASIPTRPPPEPDRQQADRRTTSW